MAYNPPPTDEYLTRLAEAYRECAGNKTQTAIAMGVPRTTVADQLKLAAERGLIPPACPTLPGYVIKSVASKDADGTWVKQTKEPGEEYQTPAGHIVKGESALVDADGRTIQKWVKTRLGEMDPATVIEWCKEALKDYEPPAAHFPLQATCRDDVLTLIPLADWHLGLFAWHKEVGQNWDLKVAESAIGSATDELLDRTPPAKHGIILGGGDLIHADNNENKTARSGNPLQVDGRYQKVVMTACRLVVRTTDAALRKHEHITLRILPGNHDEYSSVAVAYFLHAWYRNEPRVTVDVDPSLFFWHRFENVMIGATHGHTVKIAQMPQIMAHRRAEDWGATKYRYVHGFHLHHTAKTMTEGGGCVTEIHQAPVPQDAWHYGAGFLSGRSLQAITYHARHGEVGRVRVAMLDAD